MFEYIFWYEVNEWFLNDIAKKFWKIMGFQKMINSHDVQLGNSLSKARAVFKKMLTVRAKLKIIGL